MAEWSLWLDEHLLAPVPHRQVVLTLPKRLRAYFVHDRRRLGLLSQVAARTLRDYVQAAIGEYDAVPGVIACVQTFGSLVHVHPHLHLLISDGAFRRDGSFVPPPPPALRRCRRTNSIETRIRGHPPRGSNFPLVAGGSAAYYLLARSPFSVACSRKDLLRRVMRS